MNLIYFNHLTYFFDRTASKTFFTKFLDNRFFNNVLLKTQFTIIVSIGGFLPFKDVFDAVKSKK